MDNQKLDPQSQAEAELIGKRIAMLLALAPITDEQRMNLASSIEHMNGDQLAQFVQVLEANIPEGTDQHQGLKETMLQQKEAHESKQDTIMTETRAQLDDLEKELDSK